MKKLLLLFLFLVTAMGIYAQEQQSAECGQIQYEQWLERQFPGYRELSEIQYLEALKAINDPALLRKKSEEDTLFSIQVVFHILYNNPRERLPDSVLYRQLEILNEGFRHTHDDTGTISANFKPLAGDTRIQFELAKEDPQGNPTSGLNYVSTDRTWFFGGLSGDRDEFMKYAATGGVDAWNTDKYLNIWICDMSDESGRVFTLGYARPPFGAANWPSGSFNYSKNTDGVVLHYEIVGDPVLNTSYETGSHTLIHEVGHYLGLRHTWGDAPNTNLGCNVDDGIDDTPNSRQANRACNLNINTCRDAVNDLPDNVENYMDYTAQACSKMFTEKQRAMMRYNIVRFRRSVSRPVLPYVPPGKYDTLELRADIFPNPASTEIVVSFPEYTEDVIIKTEIHDMSGRKVLERKDVLNRYVVVPVSGLAAGLYVVSVTDSQRKLLVRKKIVFSDTHFSE